MKQKQFKQPYSTPKCMAIKLNLKSNALLELSGQVKLPGGASNGGSFGVTKPNNSAEESDSMPNIWD